MTFRLDTLDSAVKILNRNSNREAATLFTSVVQTVKLVSEHFGAPNRELHVEAASLRYTPYGTGQFRCSWEFDNSGTKGITVLTNPFTYHVMSTGAPGTTFTLATNSADSTASNMVRDDDVYIQHLTIDGQGKTFEFRITVSDESQPVFTGLEFEAGLARTASYTSGIY
jgi:hypothetical protein